MVVVEWLGGTCHPFPNCLAENQGGLHRANSFHRQSISADISQDNLGPEAPYQGVAKVLTVVSAAEIADLGRRYNQQGRR